MLGFLEKTVPQWYTGSYQGQYFVYNIPSGHVGVAMNNLGNVGFGMLNPSYPLQMASSGYVSAGGHWTDASSGAYKGDIRELDTEEAMKTLDGLTPVKYNYKVDKEDGHVGFIAEGVPDLVATKDRNGLSAMDIVAVLTKVVKEQQAEITKYRAEVARQQAKVASLEAQMANFKTIAARLNKMEDLVDGMRKPTLLTQR